MSIQHKNNPFKGLYPYEEKDRHIFKGRMRESKELFKLVKLNTLTVVYGKPGIGKTSLLHAGLNPQLREANFLPVPIRLDYLSPQKPFLSQIVKRIQEELENYNIQKKGRGSDVPVDSFRQGETLWEYFKRVDHVDHAGKRVTPVLVLDQFEEIFTAARDHLDQEKLMEELFYIVEDQVPDTLLDESKQDEDMYQFIRGRIAVRLVLALREDFLPQMDSIKRQIPSIDRVLFRLHHLNGGQAREAMGIPGGFYDKKTQDGILRHFYPDNLTINERLPDEQLKVEPFFLNILCYQMFEKGVSSLSGKEKDAILADFYDEVLKKLPLSVQITELIETKLLTDGGFRTPLYLENDHPLREVIDEAVKRRILRKLYIDKKVHVEVIHDVLIPVIKERRNRRLEKELKQKKLQRQKQKIYRVGAAAGIFFLFLAVFTFFQMKRAVLKHKEAVNNRLALESSQVLSTDNIKAIRIVEAAYKINLPQPPPSIQRMLSTTAHSAYEHPFYSAIMEEQEAVTSATFSPKGTAILTTSSNGTAKLYNLSGCPIPDFKMQGRRISSAIFSYKGDKIFTALNNGTAKLLDISGKQIAEFKNVGTVDRAVFSPDDTKIITVSTDNIAKLWAANDSKNITDLVHKGYITSVVFSPDSSRILTASWDNTAKLWDLEKKTSVDLQHKNHVLSADFSPDGEMILTASRDGMVKLWALKGNLLNTLRHGEAVLNALFSPDGKKILTVSGEIVKLWDTKGEILLGLNHQDKVRNADFFPGGGRIFTWTGKAATIWNLKGECLVELAGNTATVLKASISPDGDKILVCSGNNAKLWKLKTQPLVDIYTYAEPFRNALVTPDGKKILTWKGMTAQLLNLEKGKKAKYDLEHTDQVRNAAFSYDGSKILTWAGKTVKLWDSEGRGVTTLNHKFPVTNASISQDGKRILTLSFHTTAKLWNSNGTPLANLTHQDIVNSASFFHNDKKILTVSYYTEAKLWGSDGHFLEELNIDMHDVKNTSLSPNGDKILTWEDKLAKLWDLQGNFLKELKGHTLPILSATFSAPEIGKILTTSQDNTVKLWNFRGKCLANLKHKVHVRSAVLSPDGKKILTTLVDNTVKLWDLKGNLLADLDKHTDVVFDATFSKDSSKIITVSKDGTVKQWYTPEAIIDWLDKAAIPQLTPEEKKELGIADFE